MKHFIFGAAALVCATAASAQNWDMPTPYGDSTFHTQNIAQFTDDVRAATDGALDITLHSAGSLFPHAEIKGAIRNRSVPLGEVFLSRLSNEDLAFGVDSQPFVATSYEEAARDLGATPWQTLRHVVLPIIAPSLIGVALFGFTLSYDEFARTLLTSGSYNTLPLEIYGMTTNGTSPVLYALGTLTTVFSLIIIGIFLCVALITNRRRAKQASDAGKGDL